jgi:hypothetical protein
MAEKNPESYWQTKQSDKIVDYSIICKNKNMLKIHFPHNKVLVKQFLYERIWFRLKFMFLMLVISNNYIYINYIYKIIHMNEIYMYINVHIFYKSF